jgi:hypothetical protein
MGPGVHFPAQKGGRESPATEMGQIGGDRFFGDGPAGKVDFYNALIHADTLL